MTTVSAEQIAEVIVRRASMAQHVVGAQLGNSVRQTFPSVNLKFEYGGLQEFIRKYCQEKVFWVGKNGPDDVYTTILQEKNKSDLFDQADTSFWQAFTNPDRHFTPAVNPTTGMLITIPTGQQLPVGYAAVQKLTEDEHRSFAKEFLLFVENQDRAILGPVVAKEKFWPEWSERITTLSYGRYRPKWLAFRFHRIINTLNARLSSIGVSESLRMSILEKVKETKSTRKNFEKTSTLIQDPESNIKNGPAGTVSHLRELAHKAIDLMGEDELRRLRIPLGAVGDALNPK